MESIKSSVKAKVINLLGQCQNKKTKEFLGVYTFNKNLFIHLTKASIQNISAITISLLPQRIACITGKAFTYIYKFTDSPNMSL